MPAGWLRRDIPVYPRTRYQGFQRDLAAVWYASIGSASIGQHRFDVIIIGPVFSMLTILPSPRRHADKELGRGSRGLRSVTHSTTPQSP